MIDWWRELDDHKVLTIKAGLALFAAVLLAAGAVLAWRKREHVLKRTRDVLLGAVGVASVCCYFNLFHFHYDDPLHEWDIYHYYVGAKYLPELGYTRLYECTVVAENELDGELAPGRSIRNLVTNDLEPVSVIMAEPERCTSRFSSERWRSFVRDIQFFRDLFSTDRWVNWVLHDHGFNGTPVWAMLGRALASTSPASHGQLVALAWLDPLLLLAMWGAVIWAFGWRTACVAAVWWGTSYPTLYFWTGGAFLRNDWLAALVIGICLVKRERPFAGGCALAYSALLRVFPGFVIGALLLKHAAICVRARKLQITRDLRRFLLGCAVTCGVLIPSALIVQGDAGALGEFVTNSQKHLDTPLTNNMGLKTVIAYSPESRAKFSWDPRALDTFGPWKTARRETYSRRKWIYFAACAAFIALLAWATSFAPDWAALCLGAGLIVCLGELTCYYYTFLLLYALLWRDAPWAGVGLCVVSVASCVIAKLTVWDDACFYDISAYVLILIVAASTIFRFAFPRRDCTSRSRDSQKL